jgi:ribosome-associated protein
METFKFSGDYIELNKLLKASGLCGTGGMAKTEIENGLVSVDGTVEYRKRCKIRDGQTVAYGGRTVTAVSPEPEGTES